MREFAKDCGSGCLELESKSSGAVFRVEIDAELAEPLIVFSKDFQTKTLKVPKGGLPDTIHSENILRRWLVGHELHPYNSVADGTFMEKPVQQAALEAYEKAIRDGHKSFLHIAPTAMGKGRVLSRALLKRLSGWKKERRSYLSRWIGSTWWINCQKYRGSQGAEGRSVNLVNWNSVREGKQTSIIFCP